MKNIGFAELTDKDMKAANAEFEKLLVKHNDNFQAFMEDVKKTKPQTKVLLVDTLILSVLESVELPVNVKSYILSKISGIYNTALFASMQQIKQEQAKSKSIPRYTG